MKYEDGNVEYLTREQFHLAQEEANIQVGEVGFKFIKKFQGHWFCGEVIRILRNGKRVCKFNDGEHKEYTVAQVSTCMCLFVIT